MQDSPEPRSRWHRILPSLQRTRSADFALPNDERGGTRQGLSAFHHRGAWRWVLAAAIGMAAAIHGWQWWFVGDDAYIAMRFAHNLAQHGVPAFNLPPEAPVEGYTSPLWVTLLALADLVRLDLRDSAWALNAFGSAALFGLTLFSPCRRLGSGPSVGGLVAATWLALTPEFTVWASSGLETSVSAAVGLAVFWMVERNAWRAATACVVIAGFLRLDALVWLSIGLLVPTVFVHSHRARWPSLIKMAAVAGGIGLLHFVARRIYYGAWLPNTWSVKSPGWDLATTWGTDYLVAWLQAIGWWWLPWLILSWRTGAWTLLAAIGANLAFAWAVGGDFMGYSRFLLPATVLLAWLAREVIDQKAAVLSRRRWVVIAWVGVGLVGQAQRLPDRFAKDQREAWLDGKFESVAAIDQFAAIRWQAGRVLAQKVPPSTRIVVGAAGALPFAAGVIAHDVYGLVDREVALHGQRAEKPRPGHAVVATWAQIQAHRPELLCHLGWVGQERPSLRELRGRISGPYAWACVETGPVELSQPDAKPLPSHYYCCMRRIGQRVGDFADE